MTRAMRGRPSRPSPLWAMLRIAVIAVLAIAFAAWGLLRHYTETPGPMLVPVRPSASPAPTFDAEAGEIPVPERVDDRGP